MKKDRKKGWEKAWKKDRAEKWNKSWKKRFFRWSASALLVVFLAEQALVSPVQAQPFVFLDEDGETDRIPVQPASESELRTRGNTASESELGNRGNAVNENDLENRENAYAVGEWEEAASGSQIALSASLSLFSMRSVSSLGDLWDDWDADFSFLDGSQGLGTREKPYQIKNRNQLMGLSQLAAMGMRVEAGEGREEIVGSYEDAYFQLTSHLDLGGMEWNPIGYYQDSSEFAGEIVNSFCGHFDGNGKTISNFRLNHTDWPNCGFFGKLEDATVTGLTLKPGSTVVGAAATGILVGSAVNSRISDCTVEGDIRASGTAGGIAGTMEGDSRSDSVIENCTARVTVTANGAPGMFVGGIVGSAAESSIVDCRTETGNNSTARIQGPGASVGGITGFQNHTDIYNSFVTGTIGGAGSQTVGGITGRYASGHLKVARFEGTIGQSGLGTADHRGTFIGTREAGNWFRYGEDVAYLFADTESKIAADVCGSGIADDNEYTYGARIGYSHSGDRFYTLVQGGVSRNITDQYFYEVLEEGILSVMDGDNGGAASEVLGYELDHVAPGDAGQPVRGYLVTIPQIDTISNGMHYYDAAVLEARGNNTWYRTIDKDHRGAVEAGRTVTVTTAPKHTETERFQLDGVPTYTEHGGEKEMSGGTGGSYTFLMPAENTELNAVYQKVAVRVSVVPSTCRFTVVEERTGNRKNPVKTTKVLNQDGKLIASYINGMLAEGTRVQPVILEAVVDRANDVVDSSVCWSVDDSDLIHLLPNGDEDSEGYTSRSASLLLNLNAGFFMDTSRKLEEEQAKNGYRYPIPDTIYGAGYQNGGTVIVTAKTRPAASFEGKPCTANARISVTYQIKDKTYVELENLSLNQKALEFTVTRKLTGYRNAPLETITVTAPQGLTAVMAPEYYSERNVTWNAEDPSVLTVNGKGKEALVSAVRDAKWICDLIAADDGRKANDASVVLKGSGTRTTKLLMTAEDVLGNRRTAVCEGTVSFVTVDETILPGSVAGGSSSGKGGGSSGGSSGGGGGGSSSGVSPSGGVGPAGNGPASGTTAPTGSVTGTWVNTADGLWAFTANGRTYHSEWAYIHNPYAAKGQNSADWFRFDATGHMLTGWYPDSDGNLYYLWPYQDGTQGHMATGWLWIVGADGFERCYYFNPVSDGTRGRLYRNETTLDGYSVNAKGEWTVNGVVQVRKPQ